MGEEKRISKEKVFSHTMIKKAVRGGKIDFHLRDYFPNGSSLITLHVTESGIWEKIGMWNPESWTLQSGVQLKESRIPLAIGIENPSSTDKDWNRLPVIRNP